MHNKKIDKQKEETPTSTNNTCNCRKKDDCPLHGNCQRKNVVYQATVTDKEQTKTETYVGIASDFKERYRNHKASFNNLSRRNDTELTFCCEDPSFAGHTGDAKLGIVTLRRHVVTQHKMAGASSAEPSLSTGPRADRTYGSLTGHYFKLNSASMATTYRRNHSATFTSPEFEPASAYCVRFAYNMFGSDIKYFRVYAKIGTGRGYPVFSRDGAQGADWQMGQISLDSEYTSSPFRLVFEGWTNAYRYSHSSSYISDRNSDIAVDDVYVYNTSCSRIPDCPPGAYRRVTGTTTTCYTFHVAGKSWTDAEIFCRSQGLNVAGTYGWYTIGNDMYHEQQFSWTDSGSPVPMTYSNWHQGQPNDVGGQQDCLLMEYPDADYEWGDVDCSTKHPFICETNT
ncbi:hypothetical protein ScPMuIL_011533 [Solemya velum]